jgi:copper chaperone CopZ
MSNQERLIFRISGMTWVDCAATIENKLKAQKGIINALVDFSAKLAEILRAQVILVGEFICYTASILVG